jgi:ubiquinone/menaquinone biosynthesis C-methylase UbiE
VDRGSTSPSETWDSVFSDFYLRAFASDERDAEAEAQALAAVRLAGCEPGAGVLDVPCGFGRHTIPLARAGFAVVGADRSHVLLAEARRRAGDDGPELVQADYRELPFPDARFDAALNLFSSLGYLGDEGDTRALTEIGRVLRPGGRLVIETMHRDLLVSRWSEQDWRLAGEGRLVLDQRTFDQAAGIVQSTQTVILTDGRRDSRTWSIRVYTATELLAMLDRAGFAEARCYGGFDREPLGTGTRLVVVAKAGDG